MCEGLNAAVARGRHEARGRSWVMHARFVCLSVVAGLVGSRTVPEGLTLGLVWPAAGVGVLWFSAAAQRGARQVLVAASLFAAVSFAFGTVLGTPSGAISVFVGANVVMFLVAAHWPGAPWVTTRTADTRRGGAPVTTVRGVLRLTSLAAAAGLAGAVVSVAGWAWWVPSLQVDTASIVLWWGRNVTGIVGITALTLLVRDHLERRTAGQRVATGTNRSVLDSLQAALARSNGRDVDLVVPPTHPSRHGLMVAGLFVTSTLAYSLDLSTWGEQTAFPLLAFTIWSGLLCSALTTVLHTVWCTGVLVFWTLRDNGPFAGATSPHLMAAEVQVYIAFILVLGLLLAAARSEIREGLARVVTAEENSAARAQLLGAVTEAMSDGLMVVDSGGRIISTNRAASELLRLDPARVTRCEDLHLLRTDGSRLPEHAHPSAVARREGAAAMQDVVLISADGRARTLSVRATRLDEVTMPPGAPTESAATSAPVAVVFTDVTEERAKRDYLAGFAGLVAHDLRSPLTTVRGWLDMCHLLADTHPLSPARSLLEPLSKAMGGAVQMSRLIDDLMTHVSAHGQVLELEPVDLAVLAQEVAQAHGVGEALRVGLLPAVWADRALVHQLLTNLIGNAAKYRHPERPLTLTLQGHEQHGVVTFVLEDNGRGIPAAHADKVFERFYRVEEHRDAGTGTGLGLAMCRTIVERHGGTIRVLTRPGSVGATLEVTLAAVPRPAMPSAPDPGGTQEESTGAASRAGSTSTGNRPGDTKASVRHLRPVGD